MKQLPITLAILFSLAAIPASYSQSFGKLFGSGGVVDKLVNEVVDKGTKLSAQDLAGSWQYKAPASKFVSEDLLKQAGGAVAAEQLNEKLAPLYARVGVSAANLRYQFDTDLDFTNTLLGKSLSGNYTIDAETEEVTLNYTATSFIKIGSLTCQVEKVGSTLTIYFNADRLLKLMDTLSGMSSNQTIQALNSLVAQYDGLLLGFELEKQ